MTSSAKVKEVSPAQVGCLLTLPSDFDRGEMLDQLIKYDEQRLEGGATRWFREPRVEEWPVLRVVTARDVVRAVLNEQLAVEAARDANIPAVELLLNHDRARLARIELKEKARRVAEHEIVARHRGTARVEEVRRAWELGDRRQRRRDGARARVAVACAQC